MRLSLIPLQDQADLQRPSHLGFLLLTIIYRVMSSGFVLLWSIYRVRVI